MVDLGFRVPRAARAHGYLWLRLSNCGAPLIQLAGAGLDDLQGERNRADYDIRATFDQATAQHLVQLARLTLERLAAGRVEPVRTQVRDAMRDYERDVLQDVTYQGP
jgi:hypothetical protein